MLSLANSLFRIGMEKSSAYGREKMGSDLHPMMPKMMASSANVNVTARAMFNPILIIVFILIIVGLIYFGWWLRGKSLERKYSCSCDCCSEKNKQSSK